MQRILVFKLVAFSIALACFACGSPGGPGGQAPTSQPEIEEPRDDASYFEARALYERALASARAGDEGAARDQTQRALEVLNGYWNRPATSARVDLFDDLSALAGRIGLPETRDRARNFVGHGLFELKSRYHGSIPLDRRRETVREEMSEEALEEFDEDLARDKSGGDGGDGQGDATADATTTVTAADLDARLAVVAAMITAGDLVGAEAELDGIAADSTKLDADAARLARIQHNRARILLARQMFAAAQKELEEAIAGLAADLGEDDPEVLAARELLAQVLALRGDHAGAHEQWRLIYASRARTSPPDDPKRRRAGLELVQSHDMLGRSDEARALEDELLGDGSIAATGDGSGPSGDADPSERPGEDDDRRKTERERLEQVIEGSRPLEPGEDPESTWVALRLRLADIALEEGDFELARDLYWEVVDVLSRTRRDDDPDLLRAREGLGRALLGLGEHDAGKEQLEQVIEVRRRTQPESHPDVLSARAALDEVEFDRIAALTAEAAALQRNCELDAALERRRLVLAETRERHAAGDPAIAEAQRELAALLRVQGEIDEARALEAELLLLPPYAATTGRELERGDDAARPAHPPRVVIETPAFSAHREFEFVATLADLTGFPEVRFRQDGVERSVSVEAGNLTLHSDGRSGRVQMSLRIPDDRESTSMCIWAENPPYVRSEQMALVVQYLPQAPPQ